MAQGTTQWVHAPLLVFCTPVVSALAIDMLANLYNRKVNLKHAYKKVTLEVLHFLLSPHLVCFLFLTTCTNAFTNTC